MFLIWKMQEKSENEYLFEKINIVGKLPQIENRNIDRFYDIKT